MSGIEIVGLVLGAWPLIIEGIKSYAKGVSTLKKIVNSDKTLESLSRELGMERAKFENTLEILLEGTVSTEERDALMADPGGVIWKAAALHQELEELTKALKLDKPYPLDRKTSRTRTIMVILACMKNSYKEPMSTIAKINSDLETLTGQSKVETNTTTAERDSKTAVRYYNNTRKQAIALYTAFKEAFQDTTRCSCNIHITHLQLDARIASIKLPKSKDCTRFKVILKTPWNWSAIQLEPVDSLGALDDLGIDTLRKPRISFAQGTFSPTSIISPAPLSTSVPLKRFRVLCGALNVLDKYNPCAGEWRVNPDCQVYRVSLPTDISPRQPVGMVTLEELLRRPGCLNRKQSFTLGLKFALSVMQLHSTSWLGDTWGKGDIYFLEERDFLSDTVKTIIDIEKPLIFRTFDPLQPPTPAKSTEHPCCNPFLNYNKSLFSLVVVLVELSYGKRLEDLRDDEDSVHGLGLADLLTMKRLISHGLSDEVGLKYRNAVRHCISDWDDPESMLERESFKKEVYKLVIQPLLQNLEAFLDRDLSEVLQE